jgi:hypothetical protein
MRYAVSIFRYLGVAAALGLASPAIAGGAEDPAVKDGQKTSPFTLTPPSIYVSADGSTLYLIGPVIYGTYFDFIRTIRENPKVKTIYLGSEGGTAVDGLLIANQVRRRGFDTHVGHYCASTCTQIFMAGKKRSADPFVQIGFHKSYLVDEKGMVIEEGKAGDGKEAAPVRMAEAFGLDGDAALRLSYSRAGLSDAFIDHVLAVPGSEMWHPERGELESEGVLNSPAPAPPLAAPKDAVDYGQILTLLDSKAFWRAAKTRFPKAFQEAAWKLWRSRNVGVDAESAYWQARLPLVEAAAELVPTASDGLIDRLAVHDGRSAAWERANRYPSCGPATINFIAPTAEELAVVEAQEKLLTELMAIDVATKKLAADKAEREFQKSWRDFEKFGLIEPEKAEPQPADADRSDFEQHQCRVGLQINEAIARLEPKKRIKAFRALVSLPE